MASIETYSNAEKLFSTISLRSNFVRASWAEVRKMLIDRYHSDRGDLKSLRLKKRTLIAIPLVSGIQTRVGNLMLDHYGQRSSKWDIYYCSELSALHAVYFYEYRAWTKQLKIWAFRIADADPETYRLAL